jgi:hypothetical protein
MVRKQLSQHSQHRYFAGSCLFFSGIVLRFIEAMESSLLRSLGITAAGVVLGHVMDQLAFWSTLLIDIVL